MGGMPLLMPLLAADALARRCAAVSLKSAAPRAGRPYVSRKGWGVLFLLAALVLGLWPRKAVCIGRKG